MTGSPTPGGGGPARPSARTGQPELEASLSIVPPLVVRAVRPEEYDALGELAVAAYRALVDVDPDPALDPAYLAELADVARRAAVVPVLVAVDGRGQLLGGVTYVPGPGTPYSESEASDEAGIRMLAVHPAFQGRGIGRRLVEACLDRAKAAGRRRLVLLTRPSMAAARHLYLRLGFRRAPARDWQLAPGEWLLGYEIDLAPGRPAAGEEAAPSTTPEPLDDSGSRPLPQLDATSIARRGGATDAGGER